jgi:putative Mn2+ efflux pump MntP
MAAVFDFLLMLIVSFGIAVAICLPAFLIFVLISKATEKTRRDFSEIFCGVVTVVLGATFLWGARSAVIYHTPIYFKGWMYPWQAIIGGSIAVGLGFIMTIHGFCRKKKTSLDT